MQYVQDVPMSKVPTARAAHQSTSSVALADILLELLPCSMAGRGSFPWLSISADHYRLDACRLECAENNRGMSEARPLPLLVRLQLKSLLWTVKIMDAVQSQNIITGEYQEML